MPGSALAQSSGEASALPTQQPQVVEPAVKRRDIEPAAIDTENFEAGAFVGTVRIEDFGSSLLYGARIAYHFSEDIFAEATVGSAKAGKTSYEDLSGAAELLADSERQFTYYDLALGWNVLPGEVFFGSKRAMPSAVYVTLGAGSTNFEGDDHFTVVLGAGLRVLARCGSCTVVTSPATRPSTLTRSAACSRNDPMKARTLTRLALLAVVVGGGASGCSTAEPWVKPYERQHFADIIMAAERDPVAGAYLNHVFEAREGARGATGSQGGGCGCN